MDDFEDVAAELRAKIRAMDKKLDFAMKSIKLHGTAVAPDGTKQKVQITLHDAYKEATYNAAPLVGNPATPAEDSGSSGGTEPDPDPADPPVDSAEEAAARERLDKLREQLRSGDPLTG